MYLLICTWLIFLSFSSFSSRILHWILSSNSSWYEDMGLRVFVEEEARKTKRPTAGKFLWRKVMTGGKPQGFWLIIMASGFFLNMTKRGFSEVVENECHAEFFPMEFWTEKYEDELESIKRASRDIYRLALHVVVLIYLHLVPIPGEDSNLQMVK